MSRFFFISAILCLLSAALFCQSFFLMPSEPGSPLEGSFAYRLSRTDSLIEMKISLQLSNNALQFIRKENKFIARYRIDGAVYEDEELLLSGAFQDSATVEKYSITNHSDPWEAGELTFSLPKGKYKLFLTLTDRNSKTAAQATTAIKIPGVKELKFSTLWFFIPETDSVIISSRIPIEWDSLGVAAEIYELPELQKCELVISGVRYRAKTYTGKFDTLGNKIIMRSFFPIKEMPGGEYKAQLRILDSNRKKIADAQMDFKLVQTSSSMYRFHFDELLNQLELIGNPSEIESLENADSMHRDSLWEDFWQKRDPTPNTELNEAQEEFFNRIRYVNENFGTPSRPGWQTDRGRTYITYGKPDEIERHPFEMDKRPYEVWYYYSLNLTFIFVDAYGDGDYQLKETK